MQQHNKKEHLKLAKLQSLAENVVECRKYRPENLKILYLHAEKIY